MTAITLQIETAIKPVVISDEHSASSYGIPVAVVDGVAYGPADCLPIWKEDELSWIKERASKTVAAAIREAERAGRVFSENEQIFMQKFRNS